MKAVHDADNSLSRKYGFAPKCRLQQVATSSGLFSSSGNSVQEICQHVACNHSETGGLLRRLVSRKVETQRMVLCARSHPHWRRRIQVGGGIRHDLG